MFVAIRERLEKEEGFTLIELLVVVIIIGILAAIAIPTFLSQRERGWQAELTSSVRNAALEIESETTANGGTIPVQADGAVAVNKFDVASKVDVTYVAGTPVGGYTVQGVHATINSGTNCVKYIYNSATGGALQNFQKTAC